MAPKFNAQSDIWDQKRDFFTEELLDRLSAGAPDFVLATQGATRDTFRSQGLFFEPFCLAAPKGHSITKHNPVMNRHLNGRHMIFMHDGHCLSGQSLQACPSNRQGGANRLQSTSLETLRQIIASGTRYSLLPMMSVGKHPPLKHLIDYIPLADERVGRVIILSWRASYRMTANVQALPKRFGRPSRKPAP